jgi:hypothetical protein
LSIKTPESESVYAEIQIAYNDDFRCFGYPTMMHKWDLLVATFSAHNYEIADASDKEFVGINIRTEKDMNYYMAQSRMVEAILTESGMKCVRDEYLLSISS